MNKINQENAEKVKSKFLKKKVEGTSTKLKIKSEVNKNKAEEIIKEQRWNQILI